LVPFLRSVKYTAYVLLIPLMVCPGDMRFKTTTLTEYAIEETDVDMSTVRAKPGLIIMFVERRNQMIPPLYEHNTLSC